MEAMEKSSTARTNPTARWKRLNATGDGNGDEDGKNLKNEYRTKQERLGRQKAAARETKMRKVYVTIGLHTLGLGARRAPEERDEREWRKIT